jgi:N-acetylmuramoyl-L-alanine amidase
MNKSIYQKRTTYYLTLILFAIAITTISAQVVVIDPGHGYTSTGSNPDGRTATEIETALAVGLKLRTLLENNCSNWTVRMTRSTSDGWVSVTQRRVMSNDWGADRFLSIHCNAGGGTGTETFWCDNSTSPRASNVSFANEVQNRMVEKGEWRSRRVVEDNSYIGFHLGVLNGNNAVGCLNEIGFVDSSDETKLLSDSWRNLFAEAYYQSVFNHVAGTCTAAVDIEAPTTFVGAVGGTSQSDDFTASFSDADNVGVARRYYRVLEKAGNYWRANRSNGFFNDDCDIFYSVYDVGAGSWGASNGNLVQSSTASSNTMLGSYLIQDSGLPYLYEFSARVVSTSGPKKFGVHIMSDDISLSQRGNSYLIWFSGAEGKLKIYETIANALYTKAEVVVATDNNWANYKITYSPAYGVVQVWKNNISLLQWTDTTPISMGDGISFRTNQTAVEFDDIKVFKYRAGSEVLVSAGPEPTNDARRESPDGIAPSCKVQSLVRDDAGNWSAQGNADIILDFSAATALTSSSNMVVYPNPTDGTSLNLLYGTNKRSTLNISLFNFNGQLINQTSTKELDSGKHEIDLSYMMNELGAGHYILIMENEEGRQTKKLIIK